MNIIFWIAGVVVGVFCLLAIIGGVLSIRRSGPLTWHIHVLDDFEELADAIAELRGDIPALSVCFWSSSGTPDTSSDLVKLIEHACVNMAISLRVEFLTSTDTAWLAVPLEYRTPTTPRELDQMQRFLPQGLDVVLERARVRDAVVDLNAVQANARTDVGSTLS